jgi:hypothetical protein
MLVEAMLQRPRFLVLDEVNFLPYRYLLIALILSYYFDATV